MHFSATIVVTPKPDAPDPVGVGKLRDIHSSGLPFANSVTHVIGGKVFDIGIEAANENKAREQLDLMCERLLAHPLIEQYYIVSVEPKNE